MKKVLIISGIVVVAGVAGFYFYIHAVKPLSL